MYQLQTCELVKKALGSILTLALPWNDAMLMPLVPVFLKLISMMVLRDPHDIGPRLSYCRDS